MEKKFLKLCSKSIKANHNRFAKDFAVFSKKQNKKTRTLLKTKRSDTFGNWPVAKSFVPNKKVKKSENLSIAEREEQTKINLINGRKLRRRYGIFVFPESETTPLPIFKFEELSSTLNVNEIICQNLKKWKIKRPLPVQMQVIPIMVKGNDLQCCAPTGSGKTIAFIVPILTILQRSLTDNDGEKQQQNDQFDGVKCLVIAPSTVLSHQIYREFVKYSDGLQIGIYSLDENKANNDLLPIQIIISTPKPLFKQIKMDKIKFSNIQIIALDEADKLFDDDSNYFHQIESIISKCDHPQIQIALFSATLDEKTMNLTQKCLIDPYKISIGRGQCGAANIEQKLIYVQDERGKFCELLKMIEIGIKPPVLLFVSDNKRINELKKMLIEYQPHLAVDALNENQSVADKNEIVAKLRNESIWFLVCNDEMSRGMDFLNIQTVINYDFPQTSQEYIHRIGRTGRADRTGVAVTFWSDVDNALLPIVIEVIKESKESFNKLPEWMRNNKGIMTKSVHNQRRKVAKLGVTKRGPIRRGGEYIHGTSVLKQNGVKKSKKKLKRAAYIKMKKAVERKKKQWQPKKIKVEDIEFSDDRRGRGFRGRGRGRGRFRGRGRGRGRGGRGRGGYKRNRDTY